MKLAERMRELGIPPWLVRWAIIALCLGAIGLLVVALCPVPVLVLVTLLLSLGPYVPGFSLWSRLPGFSFFRAPARWSLATGLALCLLAGRGFDLLADWPGAGLSLVRFAAPAALAPLGGSPATRARCTVHGDHATRREQPVQALQERSTHHGRRRLSPWLLVAAVLAAAEAAVCRSAYFDSRNST